MNISRVYTFLGGNFRQKRMELFASICAPMKSTRILDVGGFSGFWKDSGVEAEITIVRPEGPEPPSAESTPNIRSIHGDGCDLREHADASFDIVFSNSVVEHVGGMEQQMKFAQEARRVGRSVWMQTPAFEFPIEPHVLTPFFHWLPWNLQDRLMRVSVWGLLHGVNPPEENIGHARAHLLSHRALQKLLPGAQIFVERFMGLPKSYVAYLPDSRRSEA